MKKLCLIILIFAMIFSFSACKENAGNEHTYLPKTELRSHKNSSGFYREYKTIYQYDEQGNVIKKTEYTKGLFGLFIVRENQYDIEYTYGANGVILQELIHFEDFCTSITDGHQVSDEGYRYVYNEDLQLVKKEKINPSDYEDAFCGYEYEYDEQRNLKKEYKFYADGTRELEYENNYNSQNILIEKCYMANFNDSSWISVKTGYTYDADGKLVCTNATCYEISGEYSHFVETNYHYDSFNRLIKEETTSFDMDGSMKSKDIKEYKDFAK